MKNYIFGTVLVALMSTTVTWLYADSNTVKKPTDSKVATCKELVFNFVSASFLTVAKFCKEFGYEDCSNFDITAQFYSVYVEALGVYKECMETCVGGEK